MATVTGLTAARMLEIEAASIVDGEIDTNGHLILTKHDGTEIDAGYMIESVPDATDAVKGIVELATEAETTALTSSTRAVTPASLAVLFSNLDGRLDPTEASVADHETRLDALEAVTANQVAMIGEIRIWTGHTAPTGWMVCDGSAISRTTYFELFNLIDADYGDGDGSTTFNIPDLRGRIPYGYDDSIWEFYPMGWTGGEISHALNTDEIPAHNHGHPAGTNGYLADGGSGTLYSVQNGTFYGFRAAPLASVGLGLPHNNLPPYVVMRYIIKVI